MQTDTDTTSVQVHDLVEAYENELRSLLTGFADSGYLPMTPGGPDTGLQVTPPAPTGPFAQIFPTGDGLPALQGGYTPLPNLAPPPLINIPAPLGPSATDQGQLGGGLFPGLMPGGTWYDRNSGGGTGAGAPGKPQPAWLPEAQKKIPPKWTEGVPTKKGVGVRWYGENPKIDGVRIDEGVPGSPFPSQQVDHVIVRSDGKVIGRDGQPIASPTGKIKDDPENAHIPLAEWLTWRTWNSP